MPTEDKIARAGFALLCLVVLVGIVVFPTYPNYDSYYSLLWAREILDLQAPTFQGFRVPTEHPLAIVLGILLAPFGEAADRMWIVVTFAGFVALVAGVYRLGRIAFTPLIGGIAAVLLVTRFDFAFLAARGYIDIPYMALVVWALVLEIQRPRRGLIVFLLLAASGLLRVEGWLLAAAYWVWMVPRATWGERVKWSALAAIGPLGWMATDFVVTGDPLFSIHYTSGSAEDLGRSKTFGEIPSALPDFLAGLVKLPVLLAAILGLGIATWLAPRRTAGPLLLFVLGVGTFLAIAAGGASVIERYLVIAALALLIFAGVALGGWTLLEPGAARTWWMRGAILVVLAGVGWTATQLNLRRFDNELTFRSESHDDLKAVLEAPRVTAALKCGPLVFPNHKLVPDGRWILDLPYSQVRSRAEFARHERPLPRRGVAVFATSRFAIYKHALTEESDPAWIQVPQPGWEPVARSRHYAAYARC